MLRSAFSSLLLVTVLSAPAAFAQQNSKKTAKPAAKVQPAAKTQPAPAEDAALATPAPAAASGGFAAPAAGSRVADAPVQQSEGFSIAPGFTAAPSRRVNTDYRGRTLAPYVRRNVREVAPVAMPMPAPAPEPVAAAPAPAEEPAMASASASASKKSAGAAATKKATTAPKKAPAKKAAADGWGSGGSGW